MRKIIPVVAAVAVAGGSYGYAAINNAATNDAATNDAANHRAANHRAATNKTATDSAAINKAVTLSVDGTTSWVSTRAATVAAVLQDRGITVGAHDVVAPAPSAKIDDGTRIAVRYGRQVKVAVDGRPQTVWTTATRVDQALAALDVNTTGAALSTSRTSVIGRQGLSLSVATLKTVTVDAAGHRKQLRTTARTVADVLKAAKITVDANDKLSVSASAPLTDGESFSYTKVDERTVTKKRQVAYSTVHEDSSRLKKGITRVATPGLAGVRTTAYREVRRNGRLESEKKVTSKVTEQPRTEVVLVGTRVIKQVVHSAPVTKKSSGSQRSSSSNGRSSSSAPHVSSGSAWDRIASCESGGNWSISTGNGFYGGLQFSASTWHAYGGSGLPNQSSRSAQIAVAQKVQASQGWGAWPACTAKLGIH